MKKKGHTFCLVARDKECTTQLLDNYKLKYIKRKGYKGFIGKTLGMISIDYKLLKIAKKFKPDILIGGVGNVYIPVVASIIGKTSIIFDDTEHNRKAIRIIKKFSTKIYTPTYFYKNLGEKQKRYNGHHELSYLHPKYFKPNPIILKKLGLKKNQKYIVLRLVSWEAIHDKGEHGITDKVKIISELEKYGKVFISAEGKLPKNIERYRIKISPDKMHDLLQYASLFVGEGATMASEATALGTPAIYTNTLRLGYIDEMTKYGLIFSSTDDKKIISLANKILKKNKEFYQKKRDKMLKDKIDVTDFIVKEVLKYKNE
jgi:predicted glycosyltransferase